MAFYRCFIVDPSVPSQRLIWAAYSATYYVVHYERGGRGHSYHVLVAIFTPENEAVSVAWRAVGGPFTDYADFVNVLDCGALNDDPRYGY